MTIEQLDNIKINVSAMSGALSIQQDAIKNEDLSLAGDINRDLVRQIVKLKLLVSELTS